MPRSVIAPRPPVPTSGVGCGCPGQARCRSQGRDGADQARFQVGAAGNITDRWSVFGGAVFFVRVVGPVGYIEPWVQVFSVAVDDLPSTPELMTELN